MISITIGATGVLACFPLLVPVMLNEVRLERFAHGLYDYPLPPDTIVISRHAEVALMGNGNHYDFVAEQVMLSGLGQDELETYYGNVVLPDARPPGPGAFVAVHVDGQEPGAQLNRVRIQIFDFDNPAGLDFRCR